MKFITIFQSSTIIVRGSTARPGNDFRQCGSYEEPCFSVEYGLRHIFPDFECRLLVDEKTVLGKEVELRDMELKSRKREKASLKFLSTIEEQKTSIITCEGTSIETDVYAQTPTLIQQQNCKCKMDILLICNISSSHLMDFAGGSVDIKEMTIDNVSIQNDMISSCNTDSCNFEGKLRNENLQANDAQEICVWNGSLISIENSNATMRETTVANSSEGGVGVSGGKVEIEKGEFVGNDPGFEKYPSFRRNVLCKDSGVVDVVSLKGGDGLKDNSSMWILNGGCELGGIVSERASSFFIPELERIEMEDIGAELLLMFKGKLLLPCNISLKIVKRMGEEEAVERYGFHEEGYLSINEVNGMIPKETTENAGDEVEVSACILFGKIDSPSSTVSFILKNRSESVGKGDERIVEGRKEGKSYWLLIVCVVIVAILLITLIIFIVRWRKAKNENKELREIVNDNIRKDPKAVEMVTMEMSPEKQWRRAEREAEKKNDERMKKRIYDTNMEHSESSEHLLSECGSTEYILGRDSDKIPEWALEKEEDDISRKRTPSPSISSTSTTDTSDTDTTFIRGEDLCPTTSSMSNLVDAMACSSPHEKLIVDLRDSLFMMLHGRNEKKEMAIGSLEEREQTAAQILFWVANVALHSFDEMENPLQSLDSLSPHIVLFSEHMVICIALHSDCSSSDDSSSDSSSISSTSTIVTSSSEASVKSERFTKLPPPSSAFEEELDMGKECLRWRAPELGAGRNVGATKASVVFTIGVMLWECLRLEIPFFEYCGEAAFEKMRGQERPEAGEVQECGLGRVVVACWSSAVESRPSLVVVKREFIQRFPSGAVVMTVSDAIDVEDEEQEESGERGSRDDGWSWVS
ncbi:uncharacterized protein MONOS_5112 [Monocercomonoides exilis]|uniref:uncharacterized protein n=1 Tax=Monocercomonoides exilis TaxID=2049356 RepID=UPI003559B330|nr:hypothetical protein MONOS_5112 [Monocercomonoides exilis]|eukprot:MONOS_5112.1-p1 / transcript=MONOS_5112.1 / gene=MONOS_5112 / organism=Monocercomonoides_exilis_PA203 / gene_product=unspecified product / transcript_product=unspecified product / location=Mono_scaffold00145:50908-53907(-) / protein_length=865 / sequence_SO=supercontig / SO=protein_coding / is_pseudo=false